MHLFLFGLFLQLFDGLLFLIIGEALNGFLRFIDYGVRNVAQGASCDTSMRAGPSKMAGERMARKTRSVLPAL